MGQLTFYLLEPSANNLYKQFGPDQARHLVGPDLDPSYLKLIVSLKKYFEKKSIWKKSADDKKQEKFPACKVLIKYYSVELRE